MLVGIYKGIRIIRFLRWCRISSIHSRSNSAGFTSRSAVPSGAGHSVSLKPLQRPLRCFRWIHWRPRNLQGRKKKPRATPLGKTRKWNWGSEIHWHAGGLHDIRVNVSEPTWSVQSVEMDESAETGETLLATEIEIAPERCFFLVCFVSLCVSRL